ncbi:hypothetical protein VSS95_28400, partial [Pseudomonas syringae pv. tagetis]
HTRLPIVLPERVDDELVSWQDSLPWPLAIVVHANHANEFDASVDAAITGLSNAINAADRIDELSARFSISTETLSGWGYAAKMTGSDLEGLVGIIP